MAFSYADRKQEIIDMLLSGMTSVEVADHFRDQGHKLTRNADRIIRKKMTRWGFRSIKLTPSEARKLGFPPRSKNFYYLNKAQYQHYANQPIKQTKRLYFDIETSQLLVKTWRVGYNVNLSYEDIVRHQAVICISWKWEGEDKIYNDTWDAPFDDKGLLERFLKVANTADELIAHNGDRYDIKKLRTRCIYHRIPMFPRYKTLDTLKKSRSSFSFPSNKLDAIGDYLGVGRKVEHEGKKMWNAVEDGDEEALKKMVEYCDGDILLLEDVEYVLRSYIINNQHVGVLSGELKHSCPSCGGEHSTLYKDVVTARGTVQKEMECNTCEYHYIISQTAYRNMLEIKMNAQLSGKE